MKYFQSADLFEEEKLNPIFQLRSLKPVKDIKHPVTGQALSWKQIELISDKIITERAMCTREKYEQQKLIDEVLDFQKLQAELLKGSISVKDQVSKV